MYPPPPAFTVIDVSPVQVRAAAGDPACLRPHPAMLGGADAAEALASQAEALIRELRKQRAATPPAGTAAPTRFTAGGVAPLPPPTAEALAPLPQYVPPPPPVIHHPIPHAHTAHVTPSAVEWVANDAVSAAVAAAVSPTVPADVLPVPVLQKPPPSEVVADLSVRVRELEAELAAALRDKAAVLNENAQLLEQRDAVEREHIVQLREARAEVDRLLHRLDLSTRAQQEMRKEVSRERDFAIKAEQYSETVSQLRVENSLLSRQLEGLLGNADGNKDVIESLTREKYELLVTARESQAEVQRLKEALASQSRMKTLEVERAELGGGVEQAAWAPAGGGSDGVYQAQAASALRADDALVEKVKAETTQQVQQDIALSRDLVKQHAIEVDELRRELNAARDRLTETAERHADEVKAARADVASAAEQVAALTEANAALEASLSRQTRELSAEAVRGKASAEECEALETQCSALRAERDAAKRKALQLDGESSAARADAERQAERCEALEAKLSGVESEIMRLERACLNETAAEEKCAALTRRIDEHKAKEAVLEEELAAQTREARSLELEVGRLVKSNAFLEENMRRTTQSADTRATDAQRMIDELRGKLDASYTASLERERELADENMRLETAVSELSRSVAAKQTSLDAAERMAEASNDKLTRVIGDLRDRIQRQNTEHTQHIERLEVEVSTEQRDMQARFQQTLDRQAEEQRAMEAEWAQERTHLLEAHEVRIKETESVVHEWRRRAEDAEVSVQSLAEVAAAVQAAPPKISRGTQAELPDLHAQDEIAQLRDALDGEMKAHDVTQGVLRGVEEALAAANNDVADLQTRIHAEQAHADAQRAAERAELEAQLRAEQGEGDAQLRRGIADLEAQLRSEKAVAANMQEQIDALTVALDTSKDTARVLRAKLDGAAVEVEVSSRELQAATHAGGAREEALKQDITAKGDRIAALEGEINNLRSQLTDQETQCDAKEERLQDVLEELRACREDAASAGASVPPAAATTTTVLHAASSSIATLSVAAERAVEPTPVELVGMGGSMMTPRIASVGGAVGDAPLPPAGHGAESAGTTPGATPVLAPSSVASTAPVRAAPAARTPKTPALGRGGHHALRQPLSAGVVNLNLNGTPGGAGGGKLPPPLSMAIPPGSTHVYNGSRPGPMRHAIPYHLPVHVGMHCEEVPAHHHVDVEVISETPAILPGLVPGLPYPPQELPPPAPYAPGEMPYPMPQFELPPPPPPPPYY